MAPSVPVVNLCVLRLPLKRADDATFPFSQSTIDALGITSKNKAGLEAYFANVQEQRVLLLTLLENEESVESDVDNALAIYLSSLHYLLAPDIPFRNALSFYWKDALCSSKTVVAKTLEYEIVNTLIATALWKTNHGAASMIYSETGLSTSSTARAFLLYRKAIGMVEYCEHLVKNGEHESSIATTDADSTVLTALKHLLYAEIQGITVLRAIDKGNAPSLISSLSQDAQWKYDQCVEVLGRLDVTGSFLHKISAYAGYKAVCFKSYAYLFFAWAKLSGSAGGAAVRLAMEAEKVFQLSTEMGMTYDRTSPPTDSTERDNFHVVSIIKRVTSLMSSMCCREVCKWQ